MRIPKIGRIHLGVQDLDKIQTRKTKALKVIEGQTVDGPVDADEDEEEGRQAE